MTWTTKLALGLLATLAVVVGGAALAAALTSPAPDPGVTTPVRIDPPATAPDSTARPGSTAAPQDDDADDDDDDDDRLEHRAPKPRTLHGEGGVGQAPRLDSGGGGGGGDDDDDDGDDGDDDDEGDDD
ncbi:hypothetical protein CLV56_0469 [Mumia flava]|uniref:Small secreted hydrophilic protein n=1 Tax=Mumia flava TaxID=1348852 RepID=A0A2M9BE81_9ACTN|nr:hypothetical protein [Mumia flava]PJJ56265.1 hypothetical protein CLV56_0469 [Mumia flava]